MVGIIGGSLPTCRTSVVGSETMGRRSDPERVRQAQLTGARRRLDDLQRQGKGDDDPGVA